MEAESILGVYAQLAVFIVGLSGIAGVVGHRATGNWQIADYSRFWTMMTSGFLLLFQSLFPILLHSFSRTPEPVWGWSSAVVALIVCGSLAWRFAIRKRTQTDPRFSVIHWWLATAFQVAIAIVLILNAASLGFKGTFAPYLLAMFLTLALSCMLFIRLLVVALPRS